jgi:hypothetical protein
MLGRISIGIGQRWAGWAIVRPGQLEFASCPAPHRSCPRIPTAISSETDDGDTDRATLIRYLLEGQYQNPVRVVAFKTAEGWSRAVTDEIARELREHCADRGENQSPCRTFLTNTAPDRTAEVRKL